MTLQIFDAHQDLLWYEQNKKTNEISQTGFNNINNSAVKLVVASVFIDSKDKTDNELLDATRRELNDYRRKAKENNMMIIDSQDALSDLLKSKRHGLLLHIEGVDFLNPDNIDCLAEFYELGLRSIGPVWGKKNHIMSSANDKGGLSGFGNQVINKLNKLGIIIDLAHANEESFYDVILVSTKPVMVSHGNCYELCQNSRNFTDRQINLLAQKRGVIGAFFSKKFLNPEGTPTLYDAYKQLEYLYKLAPDSTMIGSDFGGITSGVPIGLESIDKYPDLLNQIKRNLGEQASKNISYQNFLIFLENHFTQTYEASD